MKRISILVILAVMASAAILAVSPVSGKNAGKQKTAKTDRVAVITTNKGVIKFRLYEKDAPNTSANFIQLAKKKFYDGLTFHRVEPGFVIQGGDPNGNGSGGSGKNIKLEVSPKLKHDAAGVVAMARSQDPDSASCQFYITLAASPSLDMNYAVFGRVIKGMDVVNKIKVGDKMKTVRIVAGESSGAKKPNKKRGK